MNLNQMIQAIEIIKPQLTAGSIEENASLSSLNSLKTNGTARCLITVYTRQELITSVAELRKHDVPFKIIGGGTNIAFTGDATGLVLIRNRYACVEEENGSTTEISIRVASGYSITKLALETAKRGLAGLEYQFGLPGTVGGGVVMNSKWTNPDAYVGDVVDTLTVLDSDSKETIVDRAYCEFSYGYSKLQQTKEPVLDVTFVLQKEDPDAVFTRARNAMQYRNQTQPKGNATSGCFFKNISHDQQIEHDLPTKSAGYLIDMAGLKGHRVGAYYVSETHANFIMNSGDGTPEDLVRMIEDIKTAIRNRYNIELIEELELL